MRPLAAVTDFQPGIWSLVVLAIILGLAVWMAIRQRRLTAGATAQLPDDAWTAEALPPKNPANRILLAVTDDDLVLISTKSGARQSWPWPEVGSVTERSMRSRMTSYPGIRISFTDGHTEDLLVPVGAGRSAYATGAQDAHRRIAERLAGRREPGVGESGA